MNKTTIAAIAFVASTASAVAGDLPSKKTPVPPAPSVESFVQPTFVKYFGANFGATATGNKTYSGSFVAGVNTEYLGVEGNYSYLRPESTSGKKNDRSVVAINITPQYNISGTPITPYGVLGTGYSFNSPSVPDHSIYNVGVGIRYALSNTIDLDTRFVHTNTYDTKFKDVDNRLSFGVNYKF